ncbi:hypothetical protein ACHAXR_003737 [Thalassiosira sp. AJA248-18]
MLANTLIGVIDGSYDRKKGPNISGAGWILYCRATNRYVWGNFAECSVSASSYRGDLLGMLAIHIFLLAVERHFGVNGTNNEIFCDDKGAIYTFQKRSKRERTTRTSNKLLMRSMHSHHHVKAHQDDNKRRETLSLEAQLNVFCDEQAKAVVVDSIGSSLSTQTTLPMEDIAVFFNGEKQTSDLLHGLRYHLGRARSRDFYAHEGILDTAAFDQVAWDDLCTLLDRKPKMYQLWYGKQCSGYCGTGEMIGRRDKEADKSCPNCGIKVEDAEHLNQCSDEGRTNLWNHGIDSLTEWLSDSFTHPEIREWISEYLKERGRKMFSELREMTTHMCTRRIRSDGVTLRRGKLPSQSAACRSSTSSTVRRNSRSTRGCEA